MKRKKNWLKMLLIILVLAIAVFGVVKIFKNHRKDENNSYVEVLQDGTRRNTSEKLKEKKTVNGVEINNIELTEKTDKTIIFSATAKNVITEKIDFYMFQIDLLSENKEVIGSTYVSIANLKANESLTVSGILENIDISKVYDIEISKLEKVQ